MKFVSYRASDGSSKPGVLQGEQIHDLSSAGYSSLLDVIAAGAEGLQKAGAAKGAATPLSSAKLLAPIARPGKIICVGLNYLDHARESNMEVPKTPTIFSKFTNTVIGPGDEIVLPKNSEKPDYEAEFAVIIGRKARHVSEANALDYVFGYTCLNDVSARDFQMATSQWLMGKTFDTFCPMGPCIVTKDEVADPHTLDIKMTISGEVLQNSNTKELIFKIPQLIAYLSSVMTLEPGDVITTGTPAGVGLGHKPPRWLKAGDECVVSIQGIGELRNPVVAESASASTSA